MECCVVPTYQPALCTLKKSLTCFWFLKLIEKLGSWGHGPYSQHLTFFLTYE